MFGDGDEVDPGVEPIGDPSVVSEDELLARVVGLERARVELDTEEATLLAELEVRGTCDRDHGLSTARWLAREAMLSAMTARSRVEVGTVLRRHLPVVAAVLAAGTITWEHARVLVELINPRIAAKVIENQEMLVGLADRCRFEQWRAEVRSLAQLWDEDGGYDPNEDVASNKLSFGRTMGGLTSLVSTLTGDNGELVTQAIAAKADKLFRQATEDHKVTPELVVPSRRTLHALALVELIREALAVDVGSTVPARPEVTLVVGAEDPSSASTPDGVRLADGSTRALLCDPDLHALIVDSLGVPLDLSRRVRLATEAQRRAAHRRDGGCTFPGCASKAQWCDVHHCIHWDDEGVTDICNLVCLCRHHHGVTHRKGWRVVVDRDGWAVFRTPAGTMFWGQRHGRQREGPPPDPLTDEQLARGREDGAVVVEGRYHRIEDPLIKAEARQLVLRRLAGLERAA